MAVGDFGVPVVLEVLDDHGTGDGLVERLRDGLACQRPHEHVGQ